MDFLVTMGVPTAITGLLVWWLKRQIDKKDKESERRADAQRKADEERYKKQQAAAEEREKNTERLMLMIMQTSRATNVLAEATARAVQRIPDAHCNGDMTSALEKAAQIQKEEQQFLIDQGVKRIFGD